MSAKLPPPKRLLEGDEAPAVRALLERVGEPEVDAFAESRAWARLDAARRRPRRALLGWALAGAAVGLLAVALLVRSAGVPRPLPPGASLATVGLSAGAQLARAGQPFAPAAAGARVEDGSSVQTDAAGRALVRFETAAALVRPGSELKVSGTARGGLALALSRGSVVVASDKRAPDAALTVSANGYTVTVVGTVFSVTRRGGALGVQVQQGVVRVEGPAGTTSLTAGSRWSSDAVETDAEISPAELALIAALRAPRRDELPLSLAGDGGEGRLSLDGVDVGAAPLSVLALPSATALVVDAERAEPVTLVRSPGRLAAVAPPRDAQPAAPTVDAAQPEAPEPPSGPARPPTPRPESLRAASPRPTVAAAEPAQAGDAKRAMQLLQRGRSQLRAGKVKAAAETLEQAAAVESPQASLAAYELGLVRLRRLNDARGAVEAFARALRLAPQGPLAPDVSLSLIEALLAAHEFSQAEQQAQAFLERFPKSERRDTVRLLRANIHREWGDCRAALQEYDALAAKAGPEAEDALFFGAACERREGREARFRERLQQLLQAHPNGRRAAEARAALDKATP